MYPRGNAFRDLPESCELALSRVEPRAQGRVRNRRPGFGKGTRPLPRFFAPRREFRIAHSTPREHLQTGRPAHANLPGGLTLSLDLIAGLLLSGVPDMPRLELSGARTILE